MREGTTKYGETIQLIWQGGDVQAWTVYLDNRLVASTQSEQDAVAFFEGELCNYLSANEARAQHAVNQARARHAEILADIAAQVVQQHREEYPLMYNKTWTQEDASAEQARWLEQELDPSWNYRLPERYQG